MTETNSSKRLTWRLRILMAEREIRSAAELKRRLEQVGHEITGAHVARIVAAMPQRLSMGLLAALLAVLDCSPSDLLSEESSQEECGTTNRIREAPIPVTRVDDTQDIAKPIKDGDVSDKQLKAIIGPKVTAFPKPFE